jgi:hypothetical protein
MGQISSFTMTTEGGHFRAALVNFTSGCTPLAAMTSQHPGKVQKGICGLQTTIYGSLRDSLALPVSQTICCILSRALIEI